MRVVVAYKWAPNPQEATVGADGRVDWSRTRAHLSDYDAVAVQVARTLVDSSPDGGQVVGVCVGPAEVASSAARKSYLPKGFDQAVVLADDTLARLPTAATAKVLAALIARVGDTMGEVDLVICGDGSTDVGAKLVPAYLAGLLGWPALLEVTTVSGSPGDWTVDRAYGGGTQQLHVAAPTVLAVATDAAVPRPVGMKDILAAGKKPVDVLTADQLDAVDGAGAPAGATPEQGVEVLAVRPPKLRERKRHRIDGSDPQDAARELVAALRADGVL